MARSKCLILGKCEKAHTPETPDLCMRPLRAPAPCVSSLCAHFGSSLCVPALRVPVLCARCTRAVVVDMCVLEPMPAVRAHAVRARAVRLRAGPRFANRNRYLMFGGR